MDISLIIAHILLKVATKNEIDAVVDWKNLSEKNASFADHLEGFWNLRVEEAASGRSNLAHKRMMIRLNSNGTRLEKRPLIYYLSRIVASILVVLTIAGVSVYVVSEASLFYRPNWVEVSTEAGQQTKVTLPDGSIVWLNAETIVKYHPDKKERKVCLVGEAYFEVTHAVDYPFVVEAGDAKIKVLGTKFDVSYYPASGTTAASLLSGKISLLLDKRNETVDIKPGEKVIYHAGQQALLKKKAKVQNEILWKEGILYFENELFNELISKLERYYAVKFEYNKDAFENIHYTGTINNLNIGNVLEFINLTIPINYEIDNKTIRLSPRNRV